MSGRYAKNLGTHWRMRSPSVSLAAEGLNTRAESYCADVQSEGYVPVAFLAAMCGGKVATKLVAELVEVGWWEAAEGGYRVVEYVCRNGTKADAQAKTRNNAQRQQRWRDKQTAEPPNDGGDNTPDNEPRNALRDANATRSPVSSPSHQSPRELASLALESARATERDRAGPSAAAIVEEALTAVLGQNGATFVPRSGDSEHFRDAGAAMRAADARPIREVAAEWCADFVLEFRSRTPKNLALYAQSRAANGGAKVVPLNRFGKPSGWSPPAPAEAFEDTPITPELFRMERTK